MPTQRLVIVGPNLPTNHPNNRHPHATFHVHAEGCADLSRGWLARYARGESAFDFASLLDVESLIYDFAPAESEGYELGDYIDDFYFAPCVTLPRESEEA